MCRGEQEHRTQSQFVEAGRDSSVSLMWQPENPTPPPKEKNQAMSNTGGNRHLVVQITDINAAKPSHNAHGNKTNELTRNKGS